MATTLTADALAKLQCNFVKGILDRISAEEYGYDCYLYTDVELAKMKNYTFLVQSTCDLDINCASSSFVKKLPLVEICTPVTTVTCNLVITEITPASCDLYNIILLT